MPLRPCILHLVPVDGIGGVEVAAKSMRARADLPCDFRLQFIEPLGDTRRTLAGYGRVLTANWLALLAARNVEPDVIVCSLWRSVPLALALRTVHWRSKLVYFIHVDYPVHALDRAMAALAMRMADEIWGDSDDVLVARRISSERGRVISFVIERVPIVERDTAGPRFVSWGRLNRQKGFDRAIRLVAALVAQGIDACYDIYGPDGGALAELVALARELDIADRVNFPGPVSRAELPTIAARASFFLQLSRSEGMCMAAVEAMQFGLVPVVTAVGQMKHYVVDGEAGIVADPVQFDLAAAQITALLAAPGEWRARSLAAMRYWHDAPLYADDVCRAATELLDKPVATKGR